MITRKQVKARRRANKLVNLAISAATGPANSNGNPMGSTANSGGTLTGTLTLTATPRRSDSLNKVDNKNQCPLFTQGIASFRFENWNLEYSTPYSATLTANLVEPVEIRQGACMVCGVISTASCSVCGKVFYCGKAHQKKHWAEHKGNCYPCEEMKPEELNGQIGPLGGGPYMKASRDLQPMDKIFEDQPLMTGPGCCADLLYEPVCLGCTECILQTQKCSQCQWPLCGPACEKDTLHAKYECKIFSQNKVAELKDAFQYDLVRILRCLLTREKAPEVFKRLMMLDGALEHRKKIDNLIEATKTACMFIRENCKLTEFDEETINHICGVVDLQTIPAGRNRSSMQIFSFPSKLLHACDANVRFLEIQKPNGEHWLKVVACRSIRRGEPLTQRFIVTLEPAYERQRYLMEHYYFQCKCRLCVDPTEGGTYFSAVACSVCRAQGKLEAEESNDTNKGYVLPTLPFDLKAEWMCNLCKKNYKGAEILDNLDTIDYRCREFFDEVVYDMHTYERQIVELRAKIAEFEKVLHPNNFHVWKLKQLLFNSLTECILLMEPPATWQKFTETYIEEIDGLVNHIVHTVHTFHPGHSLIRGRTLHDLVAAYWGYIQWAVLFGKASSFRRHPAACLFYALADEAIKIFEAEATDIRKVADSVKFMRDNVDEVRARVRYLTTKALVKSVDYVKNDNNST